MCPRCESCCTRCGQGFSSCPSSSCSFVFLEGAGWKISGLYLRSVGPEEGFQSWQSERKPIFLVPVVLWGPGGVKDFRPRSTSRSRGALAALAPLSPRCFQNHAVFRQFGAHFGLRPPLGVKTLLAPPDQNPGSAPVISTVLALKRVCNHDRHRKTRSHLSRKHKSALRLHSTGPIHIGRRTRRTTRCKQMGPVDVNRGVHCTQATSKEKHSNLPAHRIPRPVWIGPQCDRERVLSGSALQVREGVPSPGGEGAV